MDLEKEQDVQMNHSKTNPENHNQSRRAIDNKIGRFNVQEIPKLQNRQIKVYTRNNIKTQKQTVKSIDLNKNIIKNGFQKIFSNQKVFERVRNENNEYGNDKEQMIKKQTKRIKTEILYYNQQPKVNSQKHLLQEGRNFNFSQNSKDRKQFEKTYNNNKQQRSNKLYHKKQDIKPSKQQEIFSFEIQKYPCSFCDKPIIFQQMDKHHNQCSKAFKCRFCYDFFPIGFMNQHNKVCKKNKHSIVIEQQNIIKKKPIFKRITSSFQKDDYFTEKQLRFLKQHEDIPFQLLLQHLRTQKQKKNKITRSNYIYKQNQGKYIQPWGHQTHQYHQFRRNPGFQSYNSTNSRNMLNVVFSDNISHNNNQTYKKQEQRAGLKDYQINNLVTDHYRKGQNKEADICIICTIQKQEGQLIVRLPCFHTFHKQCIVPWVKVKPVCPTCKYDIKLK